MAKSHSILKRMMKKRRKRQAEAPPSQIALMPTMELGGLELVEPLQHLISKPKKRTSKNVRTNYLTRILSSSGKDLRMMRSNSVLRSKSKRTWDSSNLTLQSRSFHLI